VQLTHYTRGTLQAFPDGWSPDGKQIIFQRMSEPGCCTEVGGFYILNLGSKQIHRLTSLRIHDNDARAAWGR
jgi:hypothetical protein